MKKTLLTIAVLCTGITEMHGSAQEEKKAEQSHEDRQRSIDQQVDELLNKLNKLWYLPPPSSPAAEQIVTTDHAACDHAACEEEDHRMTLPTKKPFFTW